MKRLPQSYLQTVLNDGNEERGVGGVESSIGTPSVVNEKASIPLTKEGREIILQCLSIISLSIKPM